MATVALLLTLPGVAAAQSNSPLFFIEKIDVETDRLSPDIVLSESLLREGREYSEIAIREAVNRVHRLPFVLLAEVSLEKGSLRGRYVLLIKIYETRRWFFQFRGNWELRDYVDRFDPRLDGDFGSRIGSSSDDLTGLIGRRFAVGKRSLVFASFGADEGALALGYQRYNLWDRNILFSLTVGGIEDIGNVSVGDSSWGATAQLGIPIRGNHALRLLTHYRRYDRYFFRSQEIESRDIEGEIAWIYNSLDDPVLPRDGFLLEAGLTTAERDETYVVFDSEGELGLRTRNVSGNGFLAAASRHWPIGSRQSLSLEGRGFIESQDRGERRWEAEGKIGHQIFLMRNQEPGRWREMRLETSTSWLRQDYPPSSNIPGLLQWEDSWSVRTGLVYRSGWGVFRLTIDYLDRDLP